MTFIDNKYQRCYLRLMERARARTLTQPFERHHVIPRSLGGIKSELVSLTYREHFIAHWLLTKFTSGAARLKMSRALWAMCMRAPTHQRILSSRQYAIGRKALPEMGRALGVSWKGRSQTAEHRAARSAALKGKPKSESHRAKLAMYRPSLEQRAQMSARMKGRRYSEETIERMRRASTGRIKSAATRAKLSAALRGRTVSDEWRAKLSAVQKGRKQGPHSVEHRARISAAARRRARDATGKWFGPAL